ncbi:hypothetical protein EG68_07840 [Paragonimus skrjabini miyazakii]|uniref:Uncharacterized protein n=1 Tax=Paragonimus skrjabini miyazakii TaxID=59628 RepID=A0A8S9Y9P6_9TREM|nr:hypothetical protein EG68_07840 [Paragonimus skrjabini miyazakii]
MGDSERLGFKEKCIIEQLKASMDPLPLFKQLSVSGVCMNSLNAHEELGTLLCNLVRSNFGLGVKILINSGLDVSVCDPLTGDTPLLLMCSEGLCGPVKQLIDHLPWEKLLQPNRSGATPLKHLLTRGHALCGCIEKLMQRLPLVAALLKNPLRTSLTALIKTDIVGPRDHPNGVLYDDWNFGSITSEMYNEHNVLLITLDSLLERIKSTDPMRVLSVIQLWIRANLLLLEGNHSERHHLRFFVPPNLGQRERNLTCIGSRLISPLISVISEVNQGHKSDPRIMLQLVIERLISLNQLDARAIWQELHTCVTSTQVGGSPWQGLIEPAILSTGFPLTLRALTVLELRRQLQKRFVYSCLTTHPTKIPTENALVFVEWVNQLVLPESVKKIIRMD